MPTPLGHSLAGLAVHLGRGDTASPRRFAYALGLVALANLPDIDFLPGYLGGNPRAYHWGPTHSLTATLLVGIVVGIAAWKAGERAGHGFLLASLAYGSHILLDMLIGQNEVVSGGLQLFWPFSDSRHMLPWSVFLSAPPGLEPLATLFSPAVLPLFARETLVLAPAALAAWVSGRSRSSPRRDSADRGPNC